MIKETAILVELINSFQPENVSVLVDTPLVPAKFAPLHAQPISSSSKELVLHAPSILSITLTFVVAHALQDSIWIPMEFVKD